MSSNKKTVLITGCSEGGIGFALAQEFHANGLRVIATARRAESMALLRESGIETLELDVTKEESVVAARVHVDKLLGGKLDILVNNAGQTYFRPAADFSMDEVRKTLDTNVIGVMLMVKEFVPLLKNSSGVIVQIGSINSFLPAPFLSVYNASKAALTAYSETIRIELAPFNIRVLVVVAGGVKTRIFKNSVSLPEGSIYAPIREEFVASYQRVIDAPTTPVHIFAKTVVTESLRKKPRPWLWTGRFSTMIWFVYNYIGMRNMYGSLAERFGLTKLTRYLQSTKAKST